MIFVHIGTHKTGSKSIRQMLADNRVVLMNRGFSVYTGNLRPNNHIEIHLASLRLQRDSFAKLNRPDVVVDENYRQKTMSEVRSFLENASENVIISSEGLCWLRFDDETERLQKMLSQRGDQIKLILYLRDKSDFLRSYQAQINKKPGRKISDQRDSVLYVQPDTWLTDYDALVSTFERRFGKENLTVLDYDDELARMGSVIPSFLQVLGLQDEKAIRREYFIHRTAAVAESAN